MQIPGEQWNADGRIDVREKSGRLPERFLDVANDPPGSMKRIPRIRDRTLTLRAATRIFHEYFNVFVSRYSDRPYRSASWYTAEFNYRV